MAKLLSAVTDNTELLSECGAGLMELSQQKHLKSSVKLSGCLASVARTKLWSFLAGQPLEPKQHDEGTYAVNSAETVRRQLIGTRAWLEVILSGVSPAASRAVPRTAAHTASSRRLGLIHWGDILMSIPLVSVGMTLDGNVNQIVRLAPTASTRSLSPPIAPFNRATPCSSRRQQSFTMCGLPQQHF